jgi:hypothetical protein
MGQPSYPPPKPPVSGGDLAISITALTITVLLGAVAAVFGPGLRKLSQGDM